MDVTKIMAGDRPPRWFTIPTGGKNEPRVRIKVPSPKILRDIGKRTGLRNVRRFNEDDLENDLFVSELVDYMILEWENIQGESEDGELAPLPCTRENKVGLMDNWLEFYSVILDILSGHRLEAEAVVEGERGN